MYNIYYIILSFITIILTYYMKNLIKSKDNEIVINPNLKSKVSVLKKKFNIKSSETSFKKNNPIIKEIRKKIISKSNVIDVVPLPLNSSSTNSVLKNVSKKLVLNIKDKFNKKKVDSTKNFDLIFDPVLKSFLNSKIVYEKIFESGGKPIISDINNFISNYKKIVTSKDKYYGYNMVVRLYNDTKKLSNEFDEKYILMKKNTLIKINSTATYKNIQEVLSKNKIFLIKNESTHYIAYGNTFNSEITSEQIKDIFFNKVDLSNEKIKKNYEMFCKYKKITIMYWISSPIVFNN